MVRDVSYRFRINGRDPITGLHAFDSRRERLRRTLLDDSELTASTSFQRRRALAQVIVLWLALNRDLDPTTLDEQALQLANWVAAKGRQGRRRGLESAEDKGVGARRRLRRARSTRLGQGPPRLSGVGRQLLAEDR